jgi:hypothetical protein
MATSIWIIKVLKHISSHDSSVFFAVSIRQHTSAYGSSHDSSAFFALSIRQHTSAYVSLLKNGLTCHLDCAEICYDIFWVRLEYIAKQNRDKKNINSIGIRRTEIFQENEPTEPKPFV